MRGLKKIVLMNLVIIIGVILSGCGAKRTEIEEIKVGVTLYNSEDVFIKSVGEEIKKRAEEIESKENRKIKVDILNGKEDMEIQSKQIDEFIEWDYDVVCINIVDRTKSAEIIDKCKSSNIPIIFFNREIIEKDMDRWDKVYYVGTDAKEEGKMQGEIAVEEYKKNKSKVDKNNDGKVQYVILEGEEGHQDTILRSKHCLEALYENGIEIEKIESESGQWKRKEAEIIMRKWLDMYNEKIEIIFSNNDEMALGARQAIDKVNEEKGGNYNPIIIGVDGTKEGIEAVKNKEILGTILSDAEIQSESIMEFVLDSLESKSIKDKERIKRVKPKKIV